MGRDRKWKVLELLKFYGSLRELFGPYHTWQSGSFPSEAKRREYKQFLQHFAKQHRTTEKAVELLIRFAVPHNGHWEPSQAAYAFRAKTCAWEAGFIRAKDFAYCVATKNPTLDFLGLGNPPKSGKRSPRPTGTRVLTLDDLGL